MDIERCCYCCCSKRFCRQVITTKYPLASIVQKLIRATFYSINHTEIMIILKITFYHFLQSFTKLYRSHQVTAEVQLENGRLFSRARKKNKSPGVRGKKTFEVAFSISSPSINFCVVLWQNIFDRKNRWE